MSLGARGENPGNANAFLFPPLDFEGIYPVSVFNENNLKEIPLGNNSKRGVLDHVSRVGVDSISLFFASEEMSISPSFSFRASGWRRMDGNRKEKKEKALLKPPQVKPNYWEKRVHNIYLRYQDQMGPFQEGIYVSFSLPALFGEGNNNFSALSRGQAKQAFLQLGRILEGQGIFVDVFQAKVFRLDLFQNLHTALPLSCYTPLLEKVSDQYLRKRWTYLGRTSRSFYWENKSRTLCIYDKGTEMQENGKGYPEFFERMAIIPEHCVRVELRYLKGRTIKQQLGISIVSDLLQRYDTLQVLGKGYSRRKGGKQEDGKGSLNNNAALTQLSFLRGFIPYAEELCIYPFFMLFPAEGITWVIDLPKPMNRRIRRHRQSARGPPRIMFI